MDGTTSGGNGDFLTINLYFTSQGSTLPLLEISDETVPGTMAGGLEHQFIVGGLCRFKEEDLNEGTSMIAIGICLTEMHTCLDDLRVVEHHQGSLRKIFREVIEHILPHLTMLIKKQFGVITLSDRKLRYAFVWERIVIVAYMYMSWICHANDDFISAKTRVNTSTPTGIFMSPGIYFLFWLRVTR